VTSTHRLLRPCTGDGDVTGWRDGVERHSFQLEVPLLGSRRMEQVEWHGVQHDWRHPSGVAGMEHSQTRAAGLGSLASTPALVAPTERLGGGQQVVQQLHNKMQSEPMELEPFDCGWHTQKTDVGGVCLTLRVCVCECPRSKRKTV